LNAIRDNPRTTDPRTEFALLCVRIEALLRLERIPEVRELVAKQADRGAADLNQLARLLTAHKHSDIADQLYGEALSRRREREERGTLLEARATLHQGPTRWGYSLAALELFGAEFRERELPSLLAEIRRASDVALLAKQVADPDLLRAMIVRQAALMQDPAESAKLLVTALSNGELPDDQLPWAARVLLDGRQAQRLVSLLEDRLRRDKPLSPEVRELLQRAYESLNRPHDADRAVAITLRRDEALR
jgi:hypothetical protein